MGIEGFESVEFATLLGEHELSGVDFGNIEKPDEWSDAAATMDFILDGKIYSAVENPDDGYRSSLRDLIVGRIAEIKNTFTPVKVIGVMAPDGEYEKHDIIQFIDAKTGLVVMRLGTGNTDDYYPYCVQEFTPENMAINQKHDSHV